MKSPNVYKTQGQLPKGWDCNVIFIANINSLFYGNEFETNILRDEIGSIDTYGGRLVPFLNLLFNKSQNLLVLERTPDPTLLEYFQKDLKLIYNTLTITNTKTPILAFFNKFVLVV